ncbi:hypothetical protein BC628DRAFT_1422575 [Trametes gibbosa]|nr:hypothetical protein BC628DRAFT_1422575 [Trametes gibbosa]
MAPVHTESEGTIDKLGRRRRAPPHIILLTAPVLSFNTPTHTIRIQFSLQTSPPRNKMAAISNSVVTPDMFRSSTDTLGAPVTHELLSPVEVDKHVNTLLQASMRQDKSIKVLTERAGAAEIKLGSLDRSIGDLKGAVCEVKGDVGQLKGDVRELKGTVAELKGSVSELKRDMLSMGISMDDQFSELKEMILKLSNQPPPPREEDLFPPRPRRRLDPADPYDFISDLSSSLSALDDELPSASHPSASAGGGRGLAADAGPASQTIRSKKSHTSLGARTKSILKRFDRGVEKLRHRLQRDLTKQSPETEDVPPVPPLPSSSRAELAPGSAAEQPSRTVSKGKQRVH